MLQLLPTEAHEVTDDTFLIPTLAVEPALPTPGQAMLDELLSAFAPATEVAA